MSATLPLVAFSSSTAVGEAQSAISTTIAQFFDAIRTILAYVLEYLRRFLSWAGEHPLATTLFVTNLIIWIA